MFTKRLFRRLALSFAISFIFIMYCQNLLIDFYNSSSKSLLETRGSAVSKTVQTTTTLPPTTTTEARGWAIIGEPNVRLEMVPDQPNIDRKKGRTRVILSTSSEFNAAHLGGCPDWNCRITNDQSQRDRADAVIFKMGSGGSGSGASRNPNQYYVYFTQESPMHSGASEPFHGYYNLTMGYRRDSDLPCPYGYAIKRKEPNPVFKALTDEQIAAKTKPIAWFVSNCNTPSKRRQYVDELKKHIDVDIYGACGTLNCPKPAQNCNNRLQKTYRFYLAFENSICTDYITEKLWNQGYQADVVPIVLKNSLVERFIPPNSYLAADNFTSVKALADHLKYLMSDNDAYRRLLDWRRHYDVIFLDGVSHDWRERPWGFCRLCDLLWQEPRPTLIKYDFTNWWRNETVCQHSLVDNLLNPKPQPNMK